MLSNIVHKQDFRTLRRNLITVMRGDAAFWCHKRRIRKDHVKVIVPFFETGQGIVLADIGCSKAMQIHIDTGKTHHIRRNIISCKILGHAGHVIRHQRGFTLLVQIALFDIIIGADQEPCRSASRIKDRFVFGRSRDLHHHINDVAGRTELPGVALTSHDGKQVFKGIAKLLAVLIGKLRNLFQKTVKCLRVTVRDIGIA